MLNDNWESIIESHSHYHSRVYTVNYWISVRPKRMVLATSVKWLTWLVGSMGVASVLYRRMHTCTSGCWPSSWWHYYHQHCLIRGPTARNSMGNGDVHWPSKHLVCLAASALLWWPGIYSACGWHIYTIQYSSRCTAALACEHLTFH